MPVLAKWLLIRYKGGGAWGPVSSWGVPMLVAPKWLGMRVTVNAERPLVDPSNPAEGRWPYPMAWFELLAL